MQHCLSYCYLKVFMVSMIAYHPGNTSKILFKIGKQKVQNATNSWEFPKLVLRSSYLDAYTKSLINAALIN